MPGFFSLLLFAGFFYLMIRFGCGAHMIHGHGRHADRGNGTPEGGTKDPVCAMDVASGEGYSEMYQGRQYRFCSRKCLDRFDAEPQRYAASTGGM
jgi:YHS domain-containing protein